LRSQHTKRTCTSLEVWNAHKRIIVKSRRQTNVGIGLKGQRQVSRNRWFLFAVVKWGRADTFVFRVALAVYVSSQV
jgi:hypothetical protein